MLSLLSSSGAYGQKTNFCSLNSDEELMAGRTKLYRLLRDDENPLENGITAKRPEADDTPIIHIRNGSRRTSQWISTSRELSAINKLIKLKRKREKIFASCRVVEIDEEKLQQYAEKSRCIQQQMLSAIEKMGIALSGPVNDLIVNQFVQKTTGQILDFTDQAVMDTHIPVNPLKPLQNEIPRGYARKYREVLVERVIPAECCIAIHNC